VEKSGTIAFAKNNWLFRIVLNYQLLKLIDNIWQQDCKTNTEQSAKKWQTR